MSIRSNASVLCRMREEAASKVAAQPATVELLQSLLEAALQSEGGSGATSDDASARSSCRSQPQSAEGSDTGLMLRDPREGGLEDGEASGAAPVLHHSLVGNDWFEIQQIGSTNFAYFQQRLPSCTALLLCLHPTLCSNLEASLTL